MSSTLDRLRRLHGAKSQRKRAEPEIPPSRSPYSRAQDAFDGEVIGRENADRSGGAPSDSKKLEELVPGAVVENEGGTCFVVTTAYPLDEKRGEYPYSALLGHHPALFRRIFPNFDLLDEVDFRAAAFIDTETTGLGGGAGVYAFMVGVGTFERFEEEAAPSASSDALTAPTHFVVRQFFMRHPAEEGALLVALADLLRDRYMTVTFNGRTFDLPLLRTRIRQNARLIGNQEFPHSDNTFLTQRTIPLLDEGEPHLDLLLPARRLWRRRLQSCRLINLERQVLGLTRSDDDVPGHLIPLLYTDYVRNGDARRMPNIFYHNREDILAMVSLAERLSVAFSAAFSFAPEESSIERENAEAVDLHGTEWLSLGHCCEAAQEAALAERAYRMALELLTGAEEDLMSHRADAFRRLGLLQKRQERWREATETWQLWLSSIAGADPTPYIELAKYCEWQIQDLEQAEMWTGWALHNLTASAGRQRPTNIIAELEHRLARIRRKLQS